MEQGSTIKDTDTVISVIAVPSRSPTGVITAKDWSPGRCYHRHRRLPVGCYHSLRLVASRRYNSPALVTQWCHHSERLVTDRSYPSQAGYWGDVLTAADWWPRGVITVPSWTPVVLSRRTTGHQGVISQSSLVTGRVLSQPETGGRKALSQSRAGHPVVLSQRTTGHR